MESVIAAAPDAIVASDYTPGPVVHPPARRLMRGGRGLMCPAVARHRLYVLDPDLMSVPGPRLLKGIAALCAA